MRAYQVPALLMTAAAISGGPEAAPSMAQTPNNQNGQYTQEFVEHCENEAIGVQETTQRVTINPSKFIVGEYLGKSLRKFNFGVNANAISEDCAPVITERKFTLNQRYRGRINNPEPVVFDSMGEMDSDNRVTVVLNRPFGCIPGKRVRAYRNEVKLEVTSINGPVEPITGSKRIKGNSDGC